jgi:L-lactate dehydrogenase (cytochrome)
MAACASGTDIVTMLALGAQGVLIGRPWVYALASGGEAAVSRLLTQLQTEMRVTMALPGHTDVAAIDREAVVGGAGVTARRG